MNYSPPALTRKTESQNQINFLDLTIGQERKKLNFSIHLKMTQRDAVIHHDPFHP
jgi:hypothetical protein